MLSLLNEKSQPNANELTEKLRDISLSNLNIKTMGYDLARRLAGDLPVDRETTARHVGLASKPCTQEDMESDWVAHWCGQLHTPVVFHRKLWELAYVLQAIYENGHMREGAKGLGFGCGVEPLPSYLAAQGVLVTMTDLPAEAAKAAGWVDTNQHVATLNQAFQPHLVTEEAFDALVDLRDVDMNAIPNDLTDYDFCWSICALEHLGTLENGLSFIENSLRTLRPGGLSVHTTELNIDAEGGTINNWATVLFQRQHFEALATRLREQGHDVAELNFQYGKKPMDRFIDLPPFHHDLPSDMAEWLGDPLHLKVGIDGFACTCFGIIVRKASDA
jgi:2-polyprenyl-3-methyl-5-hydroxy-6-metoxy-1,4-benzoquinol methylase